MAPSLTRCATICDEISSIREGIASGALVQEIGKHVEQGPHPRQHLNQVIPLLTKSACKGMGGAAFWLEQPVPGTSLANCTIPDVVLYIERGWSLGRCVLVQEDGQHILKGPCPRLPRSWPQAAFGSTAPSLRRCASLGARGFQEVLADSKSRDTAPPQAAAGIAFNSAATEGVVLIKTLYQS